jgi:hypothetical protein
MTDSSRAQIGLDAFAEPPSTSDRKNAMKPSDTDEQGNLPGFVERRRDGTGLLTETRNQSDPVPCFDGVVRWELDACVTGVWDSLPNPAVHL